MSDESNVQEWTPAERAAHEDRLRLRQENGVELLAEADDGSGITSVLGGMYGFTYSVGAPDPPIFRKSASRTFEMHKRIDGEIFLVGFATAADAARVAAPQSAEQISVHPIPAGEANVIVAVPLWRTRWRGQHSTRQDGSVSIRLVAADS